MVALPLFDIVLTSGGAAGRALKVAEQMIESALVELTQIEKIDASSSPQDPLSFDRQTAALIRGMYEEWVGDAELLLERVAQVEDRFGPVGSVGLLRGAVGRTHAMLSISLDDMEKSRRDAREGRLIAVEEVRRELRAKVH